MCAQRQLIPRENCYISRPPVLGSFLFPAAVIVFNPNQTFSFCSFVNIQKKAPLLFFYRLRPLTLGCPPLLSFTSIVYFSIAWTHLTSWRKISPRLMCLPFSDCVLVPPVKDYAWTIISAISQNASQPCTFLSFFLTWLPPNKAVISYVLNIFSLWIILV